MLDVDAAAVKLEGHYHAGERSSDKKGLMRKLRESIDPGAAEMVYAEKDRIFMRSLKEIAAELVEVGIPPRLAIREAYQIKRGNDHLANIEAVFNYAEDELKSEVQYALPEVSFIDDFTTLIEDVTNDEIRRLLGKILAGEMEAEGSFSRLTICKLTQFSKREVELIEKICTVSFGGYSSLGWVIPTPVLIGADKSDDVQSECITNYELRDLDALGIIKNDIYIEHDFGKEEHYRFCLNGIEYRATANAPVKLRFTSALFTSVGAELSRLFVCGTSPEILRVIKEEWGKLGIIVEEAF